MLYSQFFTRVVLFPKSQGGYSDVVEISYDTADKTAVVAEMADDLSGVEMAHLYNEQHGNLPMLLYRAMGEGGAHLRLANGESWFLTPIEGELHYALQFISAKSSVPSV